jgi:hypothetical protein
MIYSGCQKNVQIAGRFFCYNHHVGAKLKAKTNYAAMPFSEH